MYGSEQGTKLLYSTVTPPDVLCIMMDKRTLMQLYYFTRSGTYGQIQQLTVNSSVPVRVDFWL